MTGTQNLEKYSLEEDCLLTFSSYLWSRAGGRKGENQVKEIITDVAKFLYFVDEAECKPETVLSS